MRITKASLKEKKAYRGGYPLYGWVKVAGKKCAIIELYTKPRATFPKYGLMAPAGFHFISPDNLHCIICSTQEDLLDRAKLAEFEPCNNDCR